MWSGKPFVCLESTPLMLPSYNFFLDEVLNIRNRVREEDLARRGYRPRKMTADEALRPVRYEFGALVNNF